MTSIPRDDRCIILDLDGVLLNSHSNMRAAWEGILPASRRQVSFDEFSRFLGLPFGIAMAKLGLMDVRIELEAEYRSNSKKHLNLLQPYAGVSGLMSWLRKQKFLTTLFTSKDRERVDMICNRFGWQFSYVLCPGDDAPGKPSGAQLRNMFRESGTQPDQHAYFGDSDFDYQASIDAGVNYWHCSWGYGDPPLNLDSGRTIDRPSQMRDAIMSGGTLANDFNARSALRPGSAEE